MDILVLDSTGRVIGEVKDYTVFSTKGKKVCEAKPKTTLKEIMKILLADSMKYVV